MSASDFEAARDKIQREIEELERSLGPDFSTIDVVLSGGSDESDDDDSDSGDTSDEDLEADEMNLEDGGHRAEMCLQMNLVYRAVLQEKLQELDLLIAQNKVQQEELLWELAGRRTQQAGRAKPYPANLAIGHFFKPYFKDKATGVGPPANPEMIERSSHTLKSFKELTSRKWRTSDNEELRKAIVSDSLQRMLQPKLLKLEYLQQKCDNAKNDVEKSIIVKQIQEVERDIEDINQLPEETLLGQRTDDHDWEKISNVYFEGIHSADRISKIWKNHLHPHVNKEPWTEDEIKKLQEIAKEHSFVNWELIAEKLGTQRTAFQCLQQFQLSNKDFKKKEFTKEDDEMLTYFVQRMRVGMHIPYRKISYFMEGRDSMQLLHRWSKCLDPCLKKGPWSKEEDVLLLKAVEKYGEKDWYKIRLEVPGRSDIQCRERYCKGLHKDVKKGKWTPEEEQKLVELTKKYGVGHWAKVGREITHRTGSQCLSKWKNMNGYFKGKTRKRKRSQRTAPQKRPQRAAPPKRPQNKAPKKIKEEELSEEDISDISSESSSSVIVSSSSTSSLYSSSSSSSSEEEDENEERRAARRFLDSVPELDLWIPRKKSPDLVPINMTMTPSSCRVPRTRVRGRQDNYQFNTILKGIAYPPSTDTVTENPEDILLQVKNSGHDIVQLSEYDVRRILRWNTILRQGKQGQQLSQTEKESDGDNSENMGPRFACMKRKTPVDRSLLSAVTPWVGNVFLPLLTLYKTPWDKQILADVMRKKLSSVTIASTPIFTLLIQFFQINATGCLEMIRLRKAQQTDFLKPMREKAQQKAQANMKPTKSISGASYGPVHPIGRKVQSSNQRLKQSEHARTTQKRSQLLQTGPGPASSSSAQQSSSKEAEPQTKRQPSLCQARSSSVAPKPKTVYELLQEKRQRESRARRRSVNTPRILITPQLVLTQACVPAGQHQSPVHPPTSPASPNLPAFRFIQPKNVSSNQLSSASNYSVNRPGADADKAVAGTHHGEATYPHNSAPSTGSPCTVQAMPGSQIIFPQQMPIQLLQNPVATSPQIVLTQACIPAGQHQPQVHPATSPSLPAFPVTNDISINQISSASSDSVNPQGADANKAAAVMQDAEATKQRNSVPSTDSPCAAQAVPGGQVISSQQMPIQLLQSPAAATTSPQIVLTQACIPAGQHPPPVLPVTLTTSQSLPICPVIQRNNSSSNQISSASSDSINRQVADAGKSMAIIQDTQARCQSNSAPSTDSPCIVQATPVGQVITSQQMPIQLLQSPAASTSSPQIVLTQACVPAGQHQSPVHPATSPASPNLPAFPVVQPKNVSSNQILSASNDSVNRPGADADKAVVGTHDGEATYPRSSAPSTGSPCTVQAVPGSQIIFPQQMPIQLLQNPAATSPQIVLTQACIPAGQHQPQVHPVTSPASLNSPAFPVIQTNDISSNQISSASSDSVNPQGADANKAAAVMQDAEATNQRNSAPSTDSPCAVQAAPGGQVISSQQIPLQLLQSPAASTTSPQIVLTQDCVPAGQHPPTVLPVPLTTSQSLPMCPVIQTNNISSNQISSASSDSRNQQGADANKAAAVMQDAEATNQRNSAPTTDSPCPVQAAPGGLVISSQQMPIQLLQNPAATSSRIVLTQACIPAGQHQPPLLPVTLTTSQSLPICPVIQTNNISGNQMSSASSDSINQQVADAGKSVAIIQDTQARCQSNSAPSTGSPCTVQATPGGQVIFSQQMPIQLLQSPAAATTSPRIVLTQACVPAGQYQPQVLPVTLTASQNLSATPLPMGSVTQTNDISSNQISSVSGDSVNRQGADADKAKAGTQDAEARNRCNSAPSTGSPCTVQAVPGPQVIASHQVPLQLFQSPAATTLILTPQGLVQIPIQALFSAPSQVLMNQNSTFSESSSMKAREPSTNAESSDKILEAPTNLSNTASQPLPSNGSSAENTAREAAQLQCPPPDVSPEMPKILPTSSPPNKSTEITLSPKMYPIVKVAKILTSNQPNACAGNAVSSQSPAPSQVTIKSPEKTILDLGLISLEDETSVKDWMQGKRCTAYLPPSACTLKAFSRLLLQKKTLEERAFKLIPRSDGGGDEDISRKQEILDNLVEQKLKDNPAYNLLKQRFLSAFTFSGVLAVFAPPANEAPTFGMKGDDEDKVMEIDMYDCYACNDTGDRTGGESPGPTAQSFPQEGETSNPDGQGTPVNSRKRPQRRRVHRRSET